VVRAYLSRQHFEDVENSCPMVALPTDVARSGKSARSAFETVFRAMVSVLERSLTKNGQPRRTTAQGLAALCIGGMIVARTVVDNEMADELRASCMTVAHELAGWKPLPAFPFPRKKITKSGPRSLTTRRRSRAR
jgi:TetR/AcrR family transcriptional repressor of nem operon